MENLLKKGELIGRTAKITDAKNKANIGLEGKIIDETKNTLTIKTKKGRKKLIKKNITLKMKINNSEITINGEEIQAAPEERIKIR